MLMNSSAVYDFESLDWEFDWMEWELDLVEWVLDLVEEEMSAFEIKDEQYEEGGGEDRTSSATT